MNFNNRISAPALLAAASLAFSPAAWSLGLGQATVESYLNQPLQARIDLISHASDDLTSITARMASADDYALIGVNVEGIPVPVRFTVEDIDGDAYLSATSNLPISDPVLRLIVEVNWSSGRMLREYTLFLDPPSVPEAAPAPRIEQRANVETAPAAQPPREASAAPAAPAAAAKPAPRVAPTVAAGSEYGPVRSGETLWGIASDWSRGTDLSINQVMIAIQRENPQAFLKNNINLLKRGAILRMPQAAQVENISAAAATREVASQEEAFSGGTAARSVISPATPLLAEDSADVTAGASEATPPAEPAAQEAEAGADEMAAAGEAETQESESAAAAAPGAEQDLLELIPPSEDSDPDAGSGFEDSEEESESGLDAVALRENLARTEEELINQQQQNSYLEERIRELEAELESNKEGRVDDAELTAMQERLQEQRQAVVQPASRDVPWYNRLTFWVIGLLVIVVAFVAWLFSRRGQSEIAAEESLRSIQDEAEDVLRVLSDEAEDESESEPEPDAEAEAEVEAEDEVEADQAEPPAEAGHDEAELLDEESSDPEIQLDLARAYISMGDKEAARVILEEVLSNGNEEQQEEARKMLEVLAS